MSDPEILTSHLVETIQRGEAILFLGAGASIGAKNEKGEAPPSGYKLRDMISDRFLGGQLKSKSLAQVAEYAKNEASLPEVQQFIKDIFVHFQPADFHLLIPLFRWYAIIGTNFDLIIERAYEQCKDRQQTLSPILQDGDRFTDIQRDPAQVPYLKLHGCITHASDPHLPLILASEEYAKHRKNRERLFRHFQDWARERPVIFCGYQIEDSNIQQILFDLTDLGMHRPGYGLVDPGLDPIAARYWGGKRFTVYPSTFQEFLRGLDAKIPRSSRGLASLIRTTTTTIQPWFNTHVSPSTTLLKYLQDELEHVYKGMPTSGVQPDDFYKAVKIDWGVFQQDLDVRRRIADDVILESFLDSDSKRDLLDIYLIKGHAGSGKSVALRRIAWDIANDFDGFVFFLKEGGLLRREPLAEIFSLTGERIYLVVEDAVPHVKDIQGMVSWAEKSKLPITLLLGARTNEWNVYSGDLEARTRSEYELNDLTEYEIGQLIERLAKHNALGRLTKATPEERLEHFKLSAQRQLLVALHDLSGDKPFEEIVFDEYKNVVPEEARILYLDVCTLHRLGIGVRAGLISRISGITFEYFNRDFFRPLEHVVKTYFDSSTRDNMYRSRHPLIAEMVFRQALHEPTERASQIVRLIRSMDVDYATDDAAFRQILRGRQLAELFADKSTALRIFEAALESGAPVSVVEHQRAVFELHHRGGDLRAALAAIEKATLASEYPDKAIMHTKASILREVALASPQKLIRIKLRDEAKSIVERHIKGSRVPHPFNTMGHILLDELKEKLQDLPEDQANGGVELKERGIAESIRQAEQVLHDGLQRFPGDDFLLTLEAELAKVLDDDKRAFSALARAFEANPGRGFVTVRYAGILERRGDSSGAREVLKRCLRENPTAKEVHLSLAKLLMSVDEIAHKDDIGYHLKLSFTPGDSNLDAQFWWARYQFLYGNRETASGIFRDLSNSWMPAEYRNQIKGIVKMVGGKEQWFSGSIKKLENHYCYIGCPDLRCDVFAHGSDIREGDWQKITLGTQVSFVLGFTFRGPRTRRITLIK
ncbi:MAG: SIR2 family protein [Gallionella sp.]|nr:SIR2 family protein [Gallionella sp.]